MEVNQLFAWLCTDLDGRQSILNGLSDGEVPVMLPLVFPTLHQAKRMRDFAQSAAELQGCQMVLVQFARADILDQVG